MFRMIFYTQWLWARLAIVATALAAFAVPLLSVQNVSSAAAQQALVGGVLAEQRSWGVAYPVIAATIALITALSAWAADHRGRHIYPLSLPVPRWKYVLLRLGAGLVLLAIPALAVWLGGIAASSAVTIPPGLRAYPLALALRFTLAMLLAYAVFFSISAGTDRTALYILGLLGGLVVAQVVMSTITDVMFIQVMAEGAARWPGPLDIYFGRWMLIDV